MEAPAELIVDSAAGHPVECQPGLAQAGVVAESPVAAQQQSNVHWVRKLGGVAEAAVPGVAGRQELFADVVQQAGIQRFTRSRPPGHLAALFHGVSQFVGRLLQFVPSGVPGLGHVRDDVGEPGHAHRRGRRPVCAAEERPSVGRHENRHRPATPTGQQLNGVHVDLVDVGTFLAIDLDRDEGPVEQLGDFLVLETLPLHHVAPVAGAVADREKDRSVEFAGLLEGLRTPREPVDRVVHVLQQVGAGFFGKPVDRTIGVGVLRRGHG